MSRLQPTYTEACQQLEKIERAVLVAREARPFEWGRETDRSGKEKVYSGGFSLRYKHHRGYFTVHYPMSDVSNTCDDCGCYLRSKRDAGGKGYYYDKRWLSGDPSRRDPRLSEGYQPHYVCLPCFNRARPKLRQAEQINENRIAINRIKQEVKRAVKNGR